MGGEGKNYEEKKRKGIVIGKTKVNWKVFLSVVYLIQNKRKN